MPKEENASVEIKWSKVALSQFTGILDFIVENGFGSYAIELEDGIIARLDALAENSELYPADRFKKNNDGSWRAFEVDDYRVSYKIFRSHINIIRIRHTNRKPRKYQAFGERLNSLASNLYDSSLSSKLSVIVTAIISSTL